MSETQPPKPAAPRRVLVIMPSWVGDTVMATPFIRALKASPLGHDASILAYARPGLDEILGGLPEIEQTVAGRPDGFTGPWRESKRIRALNADAVVLLPNSWRLGFTAWLSRTPRRIGYPRDGRGWMLTDRVACPTPGGWSTPMSAVDYYLSLLRVIDHECDLADRRLRLASTSTQRDMASDILTRAGVTDDQSLALLNPGANRLDKRWSAERFASLAERLVTRHGMRILVNGSPAEAALVASIVERVPGDAAVNLCELGITLGSLKALCERVSLVVSNDTGTRHIAAGMGAASNLGLVSLFGPTDPQWARLEYEREREIVATDKSMDSITVDAVFDACDSLLNSSAVA